MADIKIKIQTSADLAALEQARKAAKGLDNDIEGLSEGFSKKLIGKAALVTVAFKAIRYAMELVSPALEGVTSAAGRVTDALGTIATRSGVIQGATAGIRVAMETLAETLEANVAPNLFKIAQNIGHVGEKFGNAAVAADRFSRSEKAAKERAGELNTELNDRLGILDRLEKRDIGKQKEEKEIALAEVAGKDIPQVERIKQRGAIEDKFARMEINRKQATLDAKSKEIAGTIDAMDQRIVAAATNIPDRERLLGDVGVAQSAADSERQAKIANREAFARRELLRGNEPGQKRFTALEAARTKSPATRTPEETMLVEMVDSAGGYQQAVSAADARIGQTRSGLQSATEARKTAFAALPPGVATREQALDYAKREELRQREIISKTQAEQESKGKELRQTDEEYFETGQSGERQATARRMNLANEIKSALADANERHQKEMATLQKQYIEAQNANQKAEAQRLRDLIKAEANKVK